MSTVHHRGSRRGLALAVIAAAQFMVIMDTSIIGVALPEIQADLGFSPQDLSWVFNAYVVAFGGLLLLGGRLSDLFGARRVFTAGWAVLAAGSLAAGLAQSQAVELAVRRAVRVHRRRLQPEQVDDVHEAQLQIGHALAQDRRRRQRLLRGDVTARGEHLSLIHI